MLATILKSDVATNASIRIMDIFKSGKKELIIIDAYADKMF